MGDFRPLADELIHSGHVIELHRCTFLAPDGSEMVRDIVRHPGAVAVVALSEDNEVVLVRQYRAPLERMMLEIPAGKLDVQGESRVDAARRELAEEVGVHADELEHLITFHNSVGFCDEESDVYLATGLTEVDDDRQGVEEEHMEVLRVPLSESIAMIAKGEITDAKTVIGLTSAIARIGCT